MILANFSGHGLLDLSAYEKHFAGELPNYQLSDEEIIESQKIFEKYPKPPNIKSR